MQAVVAAGAGRFEVCEVPTPTPGRGQALLRVKPLVTHTFRLEDYGQALHTFAERIDGALKVLVKPS